MTKETILQRSTLIEHWFIIDHPHLPTHRKQGSNHTRGDAQCLNDRQESCLTGGALQWKLKVQGWFIELKWGKLLPTCCSGSALAFSFSFFSNFLFPSRFIFVIPIYMNIFIYIYSFFYRIEIHILGMLKFYYYFILNYRKTNMHTTIK